MRILPEKIRPKNFFGQKGNAGGDFACCRETMLFPAYQKPNLHRTRTYLAQHLLSVLASVVLDFLTSSAPWTDERLARFANGNGEEYANEDT